MKRPGWRAHGSVKYRFEMRCLRVGSGLHDENIQRAKLRVFQPVNLLRKAQCWCSVEAQGEWLALHTRPRGPEHHGLGERDREHRITTSEWLSDERFTLCACQLVESDHGAT